VKEIENLSRLESNEKYVCLIEVIIKQHIYKKHGKLLIYEMECGSRLEYLTTNPTLFTKSSESSMKIDQMNANDVLNCSKPMNTNNKKNQFLSIKPKIIRYRLLVKFALMHD